MEKQLLQPLSFQIETEGLLTVSNTRQAPMPPLGVDPSEQRLLRSLHVLQALSQHPEGQSLALLSDHLHIPKASLMRLLQALEDEGYVQRDLDRQTFTPC